LKSVQNKAVLNHFGDLNRPETIFFLNFLFILNEQDISKCSFKYLFIYFVYQIFLDVYQPWVTQTAPHYL
jgi:hypothetical protein